MSGINNILPFPLGGKAPSTVDYSNLLGEFFQHRLEDGNNVVLRLVQLDLAAGEAAPEKKVFTTTSPNGVFDGQVDPCSAQTDRPAGVAHTNQEALDDNDYFLVIVEGEVTCIKGDDVTNVTAGDFVQCDNDADLGKIFTNTTTTTRALTIGRAKNATTGTDEDVVVQILDRLLG